MPDAGASDFASTSRNPLTGKRVAMVLFSYYMSDPRSRRAAEALAAAGMTVDLISLKENPRDPKHDELNGVAIRRVPIARNRGGILAYLYQYTAFLMVSSVILVFRSASRRYDLVYVHNMPDFLVLSALIPKLFGAKVILDLHDPMPELMQTIFNLPPRAKSVLFLKLVERWSLRLADAVITVNRACARIFSSRSCSAEKITVVMNSPDEMIFRPRQPITGAEKPASGRFVVMYHGSLVERNGLALAVEAFADVRRSIASAELRIYGEQNAFLDEVMKSVRERQLEHCIQYYGPQQLEDIVAAIEACDVGIIPNQMSIFTELNTPVRIFEYLALGKPVIAPRARGITDYFHEDALVFFELGNTADLARKIEYIFRNPAEVRDIVRRGQQIHKAHTWEVQKTQLMTLVTELMGERREHVPSGVGVPQRNQQR